MPGQTLAQYNRKRDFRATPEPRGVRAAPRGELAFVVQKHAARQLHYDFRLEVDGVLKSWAVPKGPSLDPAVKRMAVAVEDHPLSYGDFEGEIPAGHYGAGSVIVWDRGTWKPLEDPRRGLCEGKLKFTLQGQKLRGGFTLVRMKRREGERQQSWLLIKERDDEARQAARYDVLEEAPESVVPRKRKRATRGPRGARSRLPLSLAPQLATLVSRAPEDGDWRYELKLDGYRLLARADGQKVRVFTRNGHDWSARLPELVRALRALELESCWLDGEIVMPDERSAPDFQTLQNAFEAHRTGDIRYFVFDLLFAQGEDLRELPLTARRERLAALLEGSVGGPVQLSATLEGKPAKLLAAAAKAGFEGLMGKRADSPYRAGRSSDWIKLKNGQRQESVIGGYTDPQGSRTGFGSLLLGVHDEQGKLRYVGNVGTGFDAPTLDSVQVKLTALGTATSSFAQVPTRVGPARLKPHWVRPRLVAEVSFAGWTRDGRLRQAVFQGLRSDKPPRRITREKPVQSPPATKSPAAFASLRITHPGRVIDRASGATKGELVTYYAQVASLLLPHLRDRPVALLRAPDGVAGEKFFQKHAQGGGLPRLKRLDRRLDPEHAPLLAIADEGALLSAAQMNMVEIHTWNAITRAIEKPDRIVFDLDPGKGVEWSAIRDGAALVRTLLGELGLKSFLKTSGGSGLHVVVPLRPDRGWDEVKGFAHSVVLHLARVIPARFVAVSGPRNRVGRIFVDYLRNGRGATTVAAWSARARPGMGISVPLDWDELADLEPSAWNLANIEPRLAVGNAPWKNYERSRQGLARALARLGEKAARSRRAPRRRR